MNFPLAVTLDCGKLATQEQLQLVVLRLAVIFKTGPLFKKCTHPKKYAPTQTYGQL